MEWLGCSIDYHAVGQPFLSMMVRCKILKGFITFHMKNVLKIGRLVLNIHPVLCMIVLRRYDSDEEKLRE